MKTMQKLPSLRRLFVAIMFGSILFFSLTSNSFALSCGVGEVNIADIVCLSPDPVALAGDILNIGIVFGTLLATLFLIIGGFGVATSGGNPEALEKAKETITSAIAGLLFILMSVFILSIIGGGVIGIDFFK